MSFNKNYKPYQSNQTNQSANHYTNQSANHYSNQSANHYTNQSANYYTNKSGFNNFSNQNKSHYNNQHHVPSCSSPEPSENKSVFDSTIDNVNLNVKETILDYLYNKIEIGDHKYVIIKNISDIYEIKNNKYYVSANSCGINSLIIFMKKDNNFYSYLIDRRSISYNKQSLNKSKVRFVEIKLSVDIKLYDGTILDGILIDNDKVISGDSSNNSEKFSFMVTDAFTFTGKSLITMDYKKKMYLINECLKELIDTKNSTIKNNIKLYVSKPFEINQMNQLFKEYISLNTNKYNIKGISFYPVNSGVKLIYIFDKQDDKIKTELQNNVVTQSNDISELKQIEDVQNFNLNEDYFNRKKIIYKYELTNIENSDNIFGNLEMKKTQIPDVYKLFGVFYINNEFIKKKIGIAYIPSFKLSLQIKTLFMNRDIIIMSCKLCIHKNKWIPIEEAEVNKIDIINIDGRYKIIEEIIEDNDDLLLDDQ